MAARFNHGFGALFPSVASKRWLRIVLLAPCAFAAPSTASAQASMMRFMVRLDSAEAAHQYARARDIADSAYAIGGGQPDLLVVGAMNAARAGDITGALSRMRRAIAAGFMHTEAAATDSAFLSLHDYPAWIALLAEARARMSAIDSTLRQELLDLARQDQANRTGIDVVVTQFGRRSRQADSAFAALERVDAPIQERMRAIVAAHGWPTRRRVGDDGAHAAWLIVQHMPAGDQRRLLPLVQAAARDGEARPSDAALLEDRVLVANGKPQRYGTQTRWSEHGGASTLEPIEDEACVDKRRGQILLPPLAEYLSQFGIVYAPPSGSCAH